MTAAMRKIAAGETSTAIPAQERRDEVGAMAQLVQVFKDSMIEATRLRGEQDVLKAQADAERKLLLRKMADDFESGVRTSLDTLAGAATEMQATSKSMSATAEEASHQATTVAVWPSRLRPMCRRSLPRPKNFVIGFGNRTSGHAIDPDCRAGRRRGQSHQCHGAGPVGRGPENRRCCRTHQRHRQPDQSAGVERNDRGGPCRRSGQGFCGGRKRSQIACQPDRKSDR